MNIFFTASKKDKSNKQATFDRIINIIESYGHNVISLELQEYSDLLDLEKAKKKENKVSIHNQYIRKAIELADAAIFEASRYSFKLGQEAQMALDKKVPVLCLASERDYSEKVQDPHFYSSIYKNESDIKREVKNFLETVKSKHLNKRINVFLHNKHINYLDWYVRTHIGSNRSEVIRDAIEVAIEKDNEYNKR